MRCFARRLSLAPAKPSVYIDEHLQEAALPYIAKVSKSGNAQSVQLPKQFPVSADEVEVAQQGDDIILRPRRNAAGPWASLRAAVARGFSPDFTMEK